MPLPSNGVFSLQGHSKPGDTQYSKPKQAMIVRMSSETLDALESQPKLQFEFGDNPGIYVGDAFYSMKATKEALPHELYLRTSSAAKPNMPLKLNAIITGKFMVERELDLKVQDKVRDRTQQAERQRTERKAIILDNALPQVKGSKVAKKAKPAPQRKPITVEVKRNIIPSIPARPPPPPTPSLMERDPTFRSRLIHCLALKPRLTADIARMVVSSKTDPDENTIKELTIALEQVAIQTQQLLTTGEQIDRWKLKLEMWKEVRPFEFRDLKTQEREFLSNEATRIFESLRIPSSDPCWSHVRSKSSSTMSSAGSSTDLPPKPEPRKPIQSTKEAKAKKARADAASKRSDTITAKDERVQALRVDTIKSREKAADESSGAGTPTSAKPAVTRRLPGSGFKANPGSLTPTPPAHDPSRGGSLPPRKPRPVDVKAETSSPGPSALASGSRTGFSSNSTPGSHGLPKKPKDPQGTTAASRAQQDVAREKERRPSPTQSSSTSTTGMKRRVKDEPESEYSERDVSTGSGMLKRRKIGEGQSIPRDRQQDRREVDRDYEPERSREPEKSAIAKGKERDPSLPKKPDVSMPPPRMTKIKREASPATVPLAKRQAIQGRSPLPTAASPPGRSSLPPPPHARSPLPPNMSPMPYGRSPLGPQHSPAKSVNAHERNPSVSSVTQKRDREQREREKEREREREREKEREKERERERERDRESDRERGRERERPPPHRSNGSAKPRRKSPIYTSSEDESSHPSALDRIPSSARRGGVNNGNGNSHGNGASGDGNGGGVTNGVGGRDDDVDMDRPPNVVAATPGTAKINKMISRKPKPQFPPELPPYPPGLPESSGNLKELYASRYPTYLHAFYRHSYAVSALRKMLGAMEGDDPVLENQEYGELPDVDLGDQKQLKTLRVEYERCRAELKELIEAQNVLIRKHLRRRQEAMASDGES